MADLCIVVDVCTLDSRGVWLLQECLQRLVNLIVLGDPATSYAQLTVCYTIRNTAESCYEVEVLYAGNKKVAFRDFHNCVKELLQKCRPTNVSQSGVQLSQVLENRQISCLSALLPEGRYTQIWSNDGATRRIIYVTGQFLESAKSLRSFLQVAADKNTSIDFVLINKNADDLRAEELRAHSDGSGHLLSDVPLVVEEFENCTLQCLAREPALLDDLTKTWLQLLARSGRLKRKTATLKFSHVLAEATSTIHVSISPNVLSLSDDIGPCKTCRCHGAALGVPLPSSVPSLSCPVSGQHLDERDCATNYVKIGTDTVLHVPSSNASATFETSAETTDAMEIEIVGLRNLKAISEGLVFGDPLTVTQSSDFDFDCLSDMDPVMTNEKVFLAVCQSLRETDDGLLGRSKHLLDTGKEGPFPYYYLLFSAGDDSLIVKRIAGLEEWLPQPSRASTPLPVAARIEVTRSLEQLRMTDYNPLAHERGIYSKLMALANDSLSFRSAAGSNRTTAPRLHQENDGSFASTPPLPPSDKPASVEKVDRRPPLQLGGPPGASVYGDVSKTTSCGRERLFSPPTMPGPRRGPLAVTGHSRDAPSVQPFPKQKKPGDEHGSRLFKPASANLGTIPEAPESESRPPASKSRPAFKRLRKGKI